MKPHLFCTHLVIAAAILGGASIARADRFVLASGAVIEGTLVNRDESPRSTYQVRTASGALVTLARSQVDEYMRERLTAEQEEYHRVAPQHADTVDGQWQIAEWCRQRGLKEEREVHLRRILELDPDHVKARHALGYVQLQGKWTTRDNDLSSKGYRLYKGEWRTPQDIALIEQRVKATQIRREWLARLQRWRSELGDPAKMAAAYQQIAQVRDNAAVGPLREMLRREAVRDVKSLYLDVLAEIASPESVQAIVDVSLNDPDVEIFYLCADIIERMQPHEARQPYIDALSDANNIRINRAAHMLARLEEHSAMGLLIDRLITTHQVVVGGGGGRGGDAVSTTFERGGGGSFQAGSSTRVEQVHQENAEVRDALVKLSGVSFGYDVAAWRRWYAAYRASSADSNVRLK